MELTREALQKETDAVLDAITHPAFLEQMQSFRATPIEDRYEMAAVNLTPDALKSLGVPMPPEMRVSSRVFEEGEYGNRASVDIEQGRRIISLLAKNRPDALPSLKDNYPDLYLDLANILGGDGKEIQIEMPDKWSPMPRQLGIPQNDLGVKKNIDPEAGKWACACGGAATACGGAGGGD
ncbi:hypothetical protein [Burkholderia sp. FL-7-2-10-S1-D7]|uniref:hypothetical protein n=1 Tax=Burkholderia sp. FL-7-2-10-S1-D7 TaxID=1637866 RepID=UPI000B07CB5B|nr:hypothetical protein [Burkholderia sp. FL-7-2-10-S1-D7]